MLLRLPVIEGLIKRRLLINFRADKSVVQKLLPRGFQPKLHEGHAIVGICLIRLEQIRPKGLPVLLSLSSENAAHRIAVEWQDEGGQSREGVFIPRRDTSSMMNAMAGGRLFPGEHHHSRFSVSDDGSSISFLMTPEDERASIGVEASVTDKFPASSCFASLPEASAFFEPGCLGYSVTNDAGRLDGIELKTAHWSVSPLEVTKVQSGFFEDERKFPSGSITFDHGLLMRDIPHEWHQIPDYVI